MNQVFGELDGFLVLVSVLSTLREMDNPSAEALKQWKEHMHVCFSVLCIALSSSLRNRTIFEVRHFCFKFHRLISITTRERLDGRL